MPNFESLKIFLLCSDVECSSSKTQMEWKLFVVMFLCIVIRIGNLKPFLQFCQLTNNLDKYV